MIHRIERRNSAGKWQPIAGLVYKSRENATLALNRLADCGMDLRVKGQRVYKVYPPVKGLWGKVAVKSGIVNCADWSLAQLTIP